MTTNKQQQLLDDLDEARIELRIYRRGMWSTVMRVDLGGQAVLLCVLGSIGTLVSVCTGFGWYTLNHEDLARSKTIAGPAARLRAAERAYRNHMLES